MAARTSEGWTFPDEQAEPEDTAIPLRSKAIMAVSAFSLGTVNRLVLGSRATLSIRFDGLLAPLVAWLTHRLNNRYLGLEGAGLKRRSEERS